MVRSDAPSMDVPYGTMSICPAQASACGSRTPARCRSPSRRQLSARWRSVIGAAKSSGPRSNQSSMLASTIGRFRSVTVFGERRGQHRAPRRRDEAEPLELSQAVDHLGEPSLLHPRCHDLSRVHELGHDVVGLGLVDGPGGQTLAVAEPPGCGGQR